MSETENLTAEQLYDFKNEYMSVHNEEVSALELYSFIFPPEDIERKGDTSYRASNPIFSYCIRTKNAEDGKTVVFFRNEIVFQDHFEESVKLTQGNIFSLCSMISYSGRRKTAKNAYKCHGFIIDLDGVGKDQLNGFWNCVDHRDVIPRPTFVANSGHGLHIYYVFEHPVPLYPQVADRLQILKRGLTEWVWNVETSNYGIKERQFQGIYQSFRMVGSCTKLGKGDDRLKYLVKAWQTGDRVTISYLNHYVDEKYKCPEDPDYSSWEWGSVHHTLSECQRLWPDWYQKRVVEKQPAGQWKCNRGLYDWWLGKIQERGNAKDGNRYHCISMLYVYAQKCCIDKSIVDADASDLLVMFQALPHRQDNDFTMADIQAASKFYDTKYSKFTRKEISRRTGIEIPTCRRNGRPQAVHLKFARAARDALVENWRKGNGRPSKKDIVRCWRLEHLDGRKIDCQQDTGLSRPTILKWWDWCAAEVERKRSIQHYMKTYYERWHADTVETDDHSHQA